MKKVRVSLFYINLFELENVDVDAVPVNQHDKCIQTADTSFSPPGIHIR